MGFEIEQGYTKAAAHDSLCTIMTPYIFYYQLPVSFKSCKCIVNMFFKLN